MGETTAIAWCDHTFNPWWGCTKVSPGCKHCYAEAWAKRTGSVEWGPGRPRRVFGAKHWAAPLAWDRAAARAGVRRRVFCASMADICDPEAPKSQLAKLFDLIEATPNLDWLLLSKRPERFIEIFPLYWNCEAWRNVWLGTTVEDQQRADERIPHLLRVPAPVHFLSCEPLLGPVDLKPYLNRLCTLCGGSASVPVAGGGAPCPRCLRVGQFVDPDQVGWVIAGGESGPGARPCDVAWVRSLVGQCKAAGVPAFVKQLGAVPATSIEPTRHHRTDPATGRRQFQIKVTALRLKDRKGGDPSEWPADLRVQQFPEVTRG